MHLWGWSDKDTTGRRHSHGKSLHQSCHEVLTDGTSHVVQDLLIPHIFRPDWHSLDRWWGQSKVTNLRMHPRS